jgi:hypothetical protein
MRQVRLWLLALGVSFLVGATGVRAQSLGGYALESFDSQIEILQNTDLSIKETIKVNFSESRHGIFRGIPIVYRNELKIRYARIKGISVTDENGKVPFEVSRKGDNTEVKIGDASRFVTGEKIYVLKYQVENTLTRWSDHDELYWNVIGSGWDTSAGQVTAEVTSPFAEIVRSQCFSGAVGSSNADCVINQEGAKIEIASLEPVGKGSDLTIVVGFDKNNQLVFPTWQSRLMEEILLRWHYGLLFVFPLFVGWRWWKKGRDQKDVYGDYLEYVYAPIKNVSPAQAGVVMDQKTDGKDLIAEILELARLKYLEIKKSEKKNLIGIKQVDYVFTKLKEADANLRDYQKDLLNALFREKFLTDEKGKTVLLSALKLKLYEEYSTFKFQLSKNIEDSGWFDGSPDRVRTKWMVWISVGLFIAAGWGGIFKLFQDYWWVITLLASATMTYIIAYFMPRRTLVGYKLYRQLAGLKYYISEGKWRYENFEKNLFIEEILPIAVALGVVNKLADQMKELGMQPPQYASAIVAGGSWAEFNSACTAALGTSGGSGFSGGSAGGGSGGGSGGSW